MIYRLRADSRKFLSFDVSAYDISFTLGDFLLLDKPLWREFWQPMNATFFDENDMRKLLAMPDITAWFGYNCLALNQTAFNKLETHLSKLGEFLPVTSEGIPYFLFHSTNKTGLDCVVMEESSRAIDETGFIDVHALRFNEELVNQQMVFQTEFTGYRFLYCTEEFKALVQSNNLNGLLFSDDLAGRHEF